MIGFDIFVFGGGILFLLGFLVICVVYEGFAFHLEQPHPNIPSVCEIYFCWRVFGLAIYYFFCYFVIVLVVVLFFFNEVWFTPPERPPKHK